MCNPVITNLICPVVSESLLVVITSASPSDVGASSSADFSDVDSSVATTDAGASLVGFLSSTIGAFSLLKVTILLQNITNRI